jgi:O-acetyl-ADP-ribose deacetylase
MPESLFMNRFCSQGFFADNVIYLVVKCPFFIYSNRIMQIIRDAATESVMQHTVGKTRIVLLKGNIVTLEQDAIVNAANSGLVMGGGVAGAIRRAGGETIHAECDRIGGTPVGTAVITGGGRLPATHVIHAVGPRAGEGDEEKKLAGATRCSLEVADGNGLRSIAFPAISTGIFGFPLEDCARIMLQTTIDYLSSGRHSLEEVTFCLFDNNALEEFGRALGELS